MIDTELLQYCQTLFSKSHGTPYTILPATLLQYDGLTSFGKEVLNSTADFTSDSIDHYAQLLLKH